jgi:O-acetyl-ADP-ribose deacetylase (regulator of RNase III)
MLFRTPGDDGYKALTHTVQDMLYKEWLGYAPPGTCTLIPLPPDITITNSFDCKYIAAIPTMRVPADVRWDKDVVYDSMWSLLVQLAKHHDAASAAGEQPKIKTVLMPGLATGTGLVSYVKCAEQMALAVQHFSEARQNKAKWSRLNWPQAEIINHQIERTRDL